MEQSTSFSLSTPDTETREDGKTVDLLTSLEELMMGEDFTLKRNRQFRRCRDAAFEKDLVRPDLFSACPPELRQQIFGFIEDGCSLAVGDDLCPAPGSNSDRVIYVRGNVRAVKLVKESASAIAALARDCRAPLVARVASIQEDVGLVELDIMRPNVTHERGRVE